MAAIVDSVRPLETFPVDTDLSEEFLKKNDNGSKETPENRAEKIQELLRLLNGADSFEEDQEKLLTAITSLRSLLEKEKLLKIRKDDNFLLRYLRSSQYDPQLAIEKVKTYYNLKREHPEWYITKESMCSFKTELSNHLYFLLEDRDKFGKRIFVNKLGMIDASKTTMAKQSQLQDFFLESILDEEKTQKSGLSIIVDLKSFSWTLLKWLSPANVCIAVKKIESLPLKQIEFHVVNTSTLLNAAVKLIWPFLSAKTKENIHFHYEDWSSLHKTIDPKCLPREYGGTKEDLNVAKLLEIIFGNKEWLSGNLRMGYAMNLDS